MKKRIVRLIAVMLALLFVAGAVVSCTTGDDKDNTKASATDKPGTQAPQNSATDKPSDTDGKTDAPDASGSDVPSQSGEIPPQSDTEPVTDTVSDNFDVSESIPADLKFDGETIRILSRDNNWVNDEITVEGYAGGVSDAIYERQLKVEERLGVEIRNDMLQGDSYVVTNRIIADQSSNTNDYDIIANSCYSTIMYSGQGIMRDLGDVENLDLTRVYWSQGFNEVANIGEAQYMCTGAAALTVFRYMFITMFNIELVNQYCDVDLYDVVNNGDWTLQYQIDMCQKFADSGNADLKENGIYGFVSTNQVYIDPYWSSCDIPILKKNASNWYDYALDTEKLSSVVDQLLLLYGESNLGSYVYASTSDSADQEAVATHFARDGAATATLRLVSVEASELRDMQNAYGIIPMPKYDKAQKDYHTFLHDQFTAFGVVSLVPEERLPLIGAFLDVFGAQSYKILMPAYYEMALKSRYLQDTESGKMLDMIYENIYIDAGVLYTKKMMLDDTYGVSQKIRWFVRNNQNTVASTYNAKKSVISINLKKMQDEIKKVQALG